MAYPKPTQGKHVSNKMQAQPKELQLQLQAMHTWFIWPRCTQVVLDAFERFLDA